MEGCFNFRDLGGYAGSDGRRVRWRRLFRADGLHRLTGADLSALADLGLASVIDLRTTEEVSERGRIGSQQVAYHHLPILDVLPPREELPTWIDAEFVARRYWQMLEGGGEAVSEVLAILADPAAYPAVFHCAAGRDRTGIVASLILALLGVSDDDIIADYVLSREAMERMVDRLRVEHPDADLERYIPAMLAVVPDAMIRFLEFVRAEYGSVEGYVEAIEMGGAIPYLKAALLD
jgi:protein-tyrosine phosphatase